MLNCSVNTALGRNKTPRRFGNLSTLSMKMERKKESAGREERRKEGNETWSSNSSVDFPLRLPPRLHCTTLPRPLFLPLCFINFRFIPYLYKRAALQFGRHRRTNIIGATLAESSIRGQFNLIGKKLTHDVSIKGQSRPYVGACRTVCHKSTKNSMQSTTLSYVAALSIL